MYPCSLFTQERQATAMLSRLKGHQVLQMLRSLEGRVPRGASVGGVRPDALQRLPLQRRGAPCAAGAKALDD